MHYHLKTDNMDGIGTWGDREPAEKAASEGGSGGYTAHQLAGGWRVEECSCWMGEYILRQQAKRAARA